MSRFSRSPEISYKQLIMQEMNQGWVLHSITHSIPNQNPPDHNQWGRRGSILVWKVLILFSELTNLLVNVVIGTGHNLVFRLLVVIYS